MAAALVADPMGAALARSRARLENFFRCGVARLSTTQPISIRMTT